MASGPLALRRRAIEAHGNRQNAAFAYHARLVATAVKANAARDPPSVPFLIEAARGLCRKGLCSYGEGELLYVLAKE